MRGRYAWQGSSTANEQRGFAVPNIGPTELIIVLVIVLLIFGPKRLPGLGKQLGRCRREFQDSTPGKGGPEAPRGQGMPLGGGVREFKDSFAGKGGRDDDDDEAERDVPRRQTEAAL